MEQAVWRGLRAKGLGGLKWWRQAPIGPYIVDFYCDAARLVVEVDGVTHADASADAERDAYLRSRTIEVMRFGNNEVMANLEGVLRVNPGSCPRSWCRRPLTGLPEGPSRVWRRQASQWPSRWPWVGLGCNTQL